MPVQADVVKEVLVDRILLEVLNRYPGAPTRPARSALQARLSLPVCDGGALDLWMRRVGYLTRVVEADMFESARVPMDGLEERLRAREADGWAFAATSLSAELAGVEPLAKPQPSAGDAVSWLVPGPGGHVRHYVVAAAIAEALASGSAALPDGIRDAGELKRSWTYGFLIRCCEEALPPA